MARVVVVGAGVVGLSCAVRLLEAGHEVGVVGRDLPPETTSAVAAALWYPYRAYPQQRVLRWSRETYAELERLADDDLTGVRMLPGTELHRSPTGDPWWREAVPELTRETSTAAPYVDGWTFLAPVVDMTVYLRWLTTRIDELGGTLTRLALSDLPDRAEVVVNATGLGARRMCGDESVTPVRGQVLHLAPVELDRWWLESDHPAGPTYVVPRIDRIVVGGTAEDGRWDRRPDPDAASTILERAIRLVPALRGAPILAHRVGLRPARPSVRLEAEQRADTLLVHCYGHGGAGVTVSWGCADEVAALVP